MVRDPGEDRRLIVRIRHSFGHAAPVQFPLAFLVEFAAAFQHSALVRAVQQSTLRSGVRVRAWTPLSIKSVKPTNEPRDHTGVLNRTSQILNTEDRMTYPRRVDSG